VLLWDLVLVRQRLCITLRPKRMERWYRTFWLSRPISRPVCLRAAHPRPADCTLARFEPSEAGGMACYIPQGGVLSEVHAPPPCPNTHSESRPCLWFVIEHMQNKKTHSLRCTWSNLKIAFHAHECLLPSRYFHRWNGQRWVLMLLKHLEVVIQDLLRPHIGTHRECIAPYIWKGSVLTLRCLQRTSSVQL